MPQTDVFVPNFFSVRRRELPPITPDIPAMVLFPFLLLIAKGFEGSESTFQNSVETRVLLPVYTLGDSFSSLVTAFMILSKPLVVSFTLSELFQCAWRKRQVSASH